MKRSFLLPGLLVVIMLAATTLSGLRLERLAGTRNEADDLLYLPNGDYLQVASLGQAPVLADVIYLWAIQFYSQYEREDRFRYVEHVFGDVIIKLDPHYIDAYWMGAMILSVEAHDVDAALKLLDAGLANNPDSWMLAWIAGWESYHSHRLDLAVHYFEIAANITDAPDSVRRMRAGLLGKAGDTRRALELWFEIYNDPATDERSKGIAERQLRRLKEQADLEDLTVIIEHFRERVGRLPRSMGELVASGDLGSLPLDFDGHPYQYEASDGSVRGAEGSIFKE